MTAAVYVVALLDTAFERRTESVFTVPEFDAELFGTPFVPAAETGSEDVWGLPEHAARLTAAIAAKPAPDIRASMLLNIVQFVLN